MGILRSRRVGRAHLVSYGLRLAVLPIAAFALVACVRSFTGLEGRWNVESLNGRQILYAGSREPLWMVFRGGELSGWEGCNHFGGPYVYEGDSVGVAWQPMTLRGCGQQAEEFLDVIQSDPYVVILDDSGMRMTITSETGSVELSRDLCTKENPRHFVEWDKPEKVC
ncbi:MAG: META domain-containing protein [Actinomycetota bacterium]